MLMDTGASASVDENNCHGSYMSTLESSNEDTQDLPFNKIGNDLTEFPDIQDDRDVNAGEKCFSECATSSAGMSAEASLVGNIVQESTPHDNIKSLPTALKPVSAMKGSREKRGETPPQKLTVKWDPDVYDPVPTSVSHAVQNNKPQRQSKNSKSKQKKGSKSSRGNKHKDKGAGKRGG